jgi:hypothetical protein
MRASLAGRGDAAPEVLCKGDTRFRFFSTLTSLGTPYDITLHELRVECFFPADEATEDACRRLADG